MQMSLYPLFSCLSDLAIVALFEASLMEQKIIFLSEYPAVLTPAAEALISVMYPFYWQGVYIPLLPARLLSYLQVRDHDAKVVLGNMKCFSNIVSYIGASSIHNWNTKVVRHH